MSLINNKVSIVIGLDVIFTCISIRLNMVMITVCTYIYNKNNSLYIIIYALQYDTYTLGCYMYCYHSRVTSYNIKL